jgi:DNA adenine methylase
VHNLQLLPSLLLRLKATPCYAIRRYVLREKKMIEFQQQECVRPFLRWAGSKRQLLPILAQRWDVTYNRYVEPFVGSASLFFNLSPSSALLGDINKELIATYDQIKNNLPSVLAELKVMKKGRDGYLRLRAMKPSTLNPELRAARFIYLNRFCFNGLYRTNRIGEFNVPYSGEGTGDIPSIDALTKCSSCLQKAELVACGFEKTLEMARPGDFVYMDPPYSVKARRTFNEYDASAFDQKKLDLLRDWMIQLDYAGIVFLVSYADSEEGNFLSKDFYSEIVGVRRNIAGFAANRRRAYELLISNIKPRS